MKRLIALPSILLLSPLVAGASTVSDNLVQVAEVFNIFVGLMLLASLLMFGTASLMWVVRLGTFPTYRDEAIDIMELAVATLFVLVVVLGIVEFIETHTGIAMYFLAGIILILVIWLFVITGVFKGSSAEEKHE